MPIDRSFEKPVWEKIKKTDNTEDLPEDYFLELPIEELEKMKNAQWEDVKELDDNDPLKILYFRRFTREFKSKIKFDPELTSQSEDNFKYYAPDISRLGEIAPVEPYTETVDIPNNTKIGFVTGYHHLEKPWGRIFVDALKKQITYDPDKVSFIQVENADIPTGARSEASEEEIRGGVKKEMVTHLIDLHEQLSTLNHYMDFYMDPEWDDQPEKNPAGKTSSLDPFIPLWMIEQYYKGNIYPQLQQAINDQLKRTIALINKIKGDS